MGKAALPATAKLALLYKKIAVALGRLTLPA